MLALTISLCLALSALIFAPVGAGAEVEGYPDNFTVQYTPDGFSDYAIGGNAAAFSSGATIMLFDGGDISFSEGVCTRTQKTFSSTVTALDCTDSGFIYTLQGDEKVYNLSDGSESGAKIKNFELDQNYGGYTYSIDSGTLRVWDRKSDNVVKSEGSFSKLKFYGGEAYAADGGRLKKVTAGNVADVPAISYIDFTPAGGITAGSANEELGTVSSVLSFARVKAGYYATPVNLSDKGEVFSADPSSTFKTDDQKLNGKSVLVLYKRNNLAVISLGDQAYLTSPSALDPLVERITEEKVERTADIADDCHPYSLPFIDETTRLADDNLSGGMEIWVVKKVYAEELLHDFYLIAYADDHDDIIGYVATGHVTEFHFNEEPPQNIKDPNPSDKDDVRTVVLILAVVVLVIVAVCYLTWVATLDKRKKNKKTPPDDTPKEE